MTMTRSQTKQAQDQAKAIFQTDCDQIDGIEVMSPIIGGLPPIPSDEFSNQEYDPNHFCPSWCKCCEENLAKQKTYLFISEDEHPKKFYSPLVTCYNAFETNNAHKTVNTIIKIVQLMENPDIQIERNKFTLKVTDTTLGDEVTKVIFTTTSEKDHFTTIARRLCGDSIVFNNLYNKIVTALSGIDELNYKKSAKMVSNL